jgi:hypothetical protein
MYVLNTEPWVIGLALDLEIKKSESSQMHGVKTVAVFGDS